LFMVVVLILLTAFFVAAEFAVVKVRKTRIEYLAAQGNKRAAAVKKVISNLDGYLSACQLGITITALGIGWLGEPAVAHLLHPLFAWFGFSESVVSTLSFIIAFSVITFLHVVLGELVPKSFSIQKTETISLLVAPPLIFFDKVMYPFIWALNGSARSIGRLFGLKSVNEGEEAHSEEELRLILSDSYESGKINAAEMNYVNKIFQFDERVAKEIMVPRTEIVCIFNDNTTEENINIMKEGTFTRYPIADGDKDHIIGIVNIKELFNDYIGQKKNAPESFIRPVIHVAESTPVKELLTKMQKERSHMAIIVDEYGGTAGLVTVEDILEEIVGEIQDEFDEDEIPRIQQMDEDTVLLDGKVLISDVNDLLRIRIDDEELDTIGGWILSEHVDATQGTVIGHADYQFTVKEADGHQVKLIEAKKINKDNALDRGDD
jgi:CBS domain containing-hemolysin-like protein